MPIAPALLTIAFAAFALGLFADAIGETRRNVEKIVKHLGLDKPPEEKEENP